MSEAQKKLVIITAPSGSGKTTVVNYLLREVPKLSFSISACTREPRANEVNGVNYYFLPLSTFQNRIQRNDFVEYEMVYEGKYYGTLKNELKRIWNMQQVPLLDIDVHGAKRILDTEQYDVKSIFIEPPSLNVLERRLRSRGTESEDSLQERMKKARSEMDYAYFFKHIVVNDDLEKTCKEVKRIVEEFLMK